MANNLWKSFERWVGQNIFDGSVRNIGSGAINSDDNGKPRSGDLINKTYEIECKCYQKIAIFRWWDKLAPEAKLSGKIPVLVTREKGDIQDTLITIHWTTFNEMKAAWEREKGIR
ncbi:hypothetical protein [Peribacillus frigoritolerans]|uniref:Restriction endonuclease n=1 Tax=Peribacillus castrilensis TaxID=2897690 RepID=A0AAW9NEI9_9BACI|nr:hypothetical protein [Peribacillus castrilensis]